MLCYACVPFSLLKSGQARGHWFDIFVFTLNSRNRCHIHFRTHNWTHSEYTGKILLYLKYEVSWLDSLCSNMLIMPLMNRLRRRLFFAWSNGVVTIHPALTLYGEKEQKQCLALSNVINAFRRKGHNALGFWYGFGRRYWINLNLAEAHHF